MGFSCKKMGFCKFPMPARQLLHNAFSLPSRVSGRSRGLTAANRLMASDRHFLQARATVLGDIRRCVGFGCC